MSEVIRTTDVIKQPITKPEATALIDIISAMDVDELAVIADNIPIELCFKRVEKEIKKYKAFTEATEEALDILKSRA